MAVYIISFHPRHGLLVCNNVLYVIVAGPPSFPAASLSALTPSPPPSYFCPLDQDGRSRLLCTILPGSVGGPRSVPVYCALQCSRRKIRRLILGAAFEVGRNR